MRPFTSFFGVELRIGVKLICKSFLLVVAVSLALNIYMLDYPGKEREESLLSLGVWILFIVLLSVSAFTGHAGAFREQLSLVVTSLSVLTLAILHWLIVGIVSMKKSNHTAMWNVCIQNRCAETFWTYDFGYRNATPQHRVVVPLKRRGVAGRPSSPNQNSIKTYSENKQRRHKDSAEDHNDEWSVEYDNEAVDLLIKGDQHSVEYDESDYEGPDFEERVRSQTRKPVDVWKRFNHHDIKKKDQATTLSLVITLVFFLLDIESSCR